MVNSSMGSAGRTPSEVQGRTAKAYCDNGKGGVSSIIPDKKEARIALHRRDSITPGENCTLKWHTDPSIGVQVVSLSHVLGQTFSHFPVIGMTGWHHAGFLLFLKCFLPSPQCHAMAPFVPYAYCFRYVHSCRTGHAAKGRPCSCSSAVGLIALQCLANDSPSSGTKW